MVFSIGPEVKWTQPIVVNNGLFDGGADIDIYIWDKLEVIDGELISNGYKPISWKIEKSINVTECSVGYVGKG
jgi:hypothetical protein